MVAHKNKKKNVAIKCEVIARKYGVMRISDELRLSAMSTNGIWMH